MPTSARHPKPKTRAHKKTAPKNLHAQEAPKSKTPDTPAPQEKSWQKKWLAALLTALQKHLGDLAMVGLALAAALTLFALTGKTEATWLGTVAHGLRSAFGWGALLIPLTLAWWAWLLFDRQMRRASPTTEPPTPPPAAMRWGRVVAAEVAASALLGLLNFANGDSVALAAQGQGGGMVGWGLHTLVARLFPPPTDGFVLLMLLLGGLVLALPVTADRLSRLGPWLRSYAGQEARPPALPQFAPPIGSPRQLPLHLPPPAPGKKAPLAAIVPAMTSKPRPKLTAGERVSVPAETAGPDVKVKAKKRDKRLPGLELLNNSEMRAPAQREIDTNASIIVKTLKEFGVPVEVVGARIGPSVTQYQVEPGFVDKSGPVTGNLAKALEALQSLGAYFEKHTDQSELDVINYTVNKSGLFEALGYEAGTEEHIERNRNSVFLRTPKGRTLVIVEFRRPSKEVSISDKQWDEDPLPEVGAVCNGRTLWVSRFSGNRMSADTLVEIDLAEADETDARAVLTWLGKRQQWKVRVAQIASLKDDLALALAANAIRIEAPVPGQSYVGVEVPHRRNSLVSLRPILESEAFHKINSPLAVALGRDVSGAPIAADLATMPHLLIAGTTGSGKSVCIVSIITCLVTNNTPDDLRMVLIDPKMVELVRFNGLPHLLGKVETDLDRIMGVLRWVTREMDRRYKLFEQHHARNLKTYSEKIAHKEEAERLPHLVVVIDELADLMLRAPDETERTVVRLAQMARATGIHLVVATQRPSTDIVTGLIKANFPARISFAVASSIDSRVILDTGGAEALLGRGDMLALLPEIGTPMRLQGGFVTDKEIDKIVAYWIEQMDGEEPEPLPLNDIAAPAPAENKPGSTTPARSPWDEMLARESVLEDTDLQIEQAIEIIKKHGHASASLLQRKMRIGFPRAARLMDELNKMGVIGMEQSGGKTREVLRRGDGHDPVGERAAQILGGEEDDE